VNMVGELMISQAMVSQNGQVAVSPQLLMAVNRQGRIVRDLQTLSLSLRMVPVKATFQKMARAVHDTEVFGPAATIIPYRSENEAFALIARGGGSLVVSIFGDDREFLARAVSELGPTHGRVLAVDPPIVDTHTGHGIVMPQCHHGGPGRAGNGAELGGLYGLRFYHQRVAVQGSTDLLDDLQVKAAALH